MKQGKFITFEGTEGAGKSTQIPIIRDWLISKGIDCIVTREPGGTPLAEKIRTLLLADEMVPETELLLMFAARKDHIEKVIKPAMLSGKWVLCDRFTEATYAYQAAGRAIEIHYIEMLEEWLQGNLRPDITFWFDLPVECGLMRAKKRESSDRFENETISFFNRVRDGYAKISTLKVQQFVTIDALGDIAEISNELKKQIACKFNI